MREPSRSDKRVATSGGAAGDQTAADAATLRQLYSEALRAVLADPLEALAEHNPVLAKLLTRGRGAG